MTANVDISDESREKNGKWNHLVKYCLELYEEIDKSEYRSRKLTEIKESTSTYLQEEKQTDDPWPGASNITLPLTTISIDNLEPRLVSGFVGKRPYIRFEMEAEQKQDPQTEQLQNWFDQELEDVVKIEHRTGKLVHQILKEGTVYPMPVYDLDERPRRDFIFAGEENDPEKLAYLVANEIIERDEAGGVRLNGSVLGGVYVDAEGMPVTIDRTETVFEGGKLEFVPFKDVFIPDDAEDWESTPVIRKVYPTYAELQRSKDKLGYMNIDDDLLTIEKERKLSEKQQSETQSLEGAQVTSKEVIECIECSISYIYQDEDQEKEDITNFTEERLIAQIALDKKVLIRLLPLRDINFKNEHTIRRIRMFPEEGLAYGTSLYGKLKSIQKGASKTFNMAMNIAEVVMIPWFLYDQRSGIDRTVGKKSGQNQKKLKPGEGIPVDNTEGLYFPRFNVNPSQMIEFLYLWVSYWEKVVSIGDLQAGRPSESRGKKTTATEVMAVIQEGNIKHNYQARTMREEFLGVLRTLYDLYYQNMPLEKRFLYNGQMVEIPRAAMRRRYRFKLTGSTEISNKLIERKESEDLYGMMLQNPVANPIKATTELIKRYGYTDTDEWVDPTINQIIMAIKEIPGAAELFQQSLQQAQELAQGMEQEAGGEMA